MQWAFGAFVLDSGRHELLRDGRPLHVSPKAYALLEALVQSRPDALSKADLLERLWPDTIVVEANLANLVAEVRAALGDKSGSPRFIRTLHRFGYAFCGDVAETTDRRIRRATLLYQFEAKSGTVELGEGENLLGRGKDSILLLPTGTVSRRHALIRISGDEAILEDLGSKNGTRLAGRRITEPTRLADGDEIRVGSVLLTFRTSTVTELSTQTGPSSSVS